MKRFLDILFSSFGILVLSPVLFITILILRLTGEGEIFLFKIELAKIKDFWAFKVCNYDEG